MSKVLRNRQKHKTYSEYKKTLFQEIKNDQNKWKGILYLWIEILSVKMAIENQGWENQHSCRNSVMSKTDKSGYVHRAYL